MLTFEDVTTRGNYYPDKSMATAAVSILFSFKTLVTDMIAESPAVPPHHEYHEERPRAGSHQDRRANEAGIAEFG
jgi:hypothetical protein